MGTPGSQGAGAPWLLGALLAGALGGCRVAAVEVHNLREVHEPDGSPRRFGDLEGVFEHFGRGVLEALRMSGGGAEALQPRDEPIDDPHGECLDNVLGLAHCDRDDPLVRGQQVELFSWLAVDCQYVLTRERCCLELGELGSRIGVEGLERIAEDVAVLEPGPALDWLRDLEAAWKKTLDVDRVAGARELAAACEALDVEWLDRDGARRLLRAVCVFRARRDFDAPELEPLGRLQDALERRAIALALVAALTDPQARVRAAALEAAVRMTDNGIPTLLRAGLGDRHGQVVKRALDLIAELGLPEREEGFGGGVDDYREAWLELLVRVLRLAFDGPVSVAACRAMGTASDAGFHDLRPEVWVRWWEERQAALPAPADTR